jgi:hypothetical protein
MHNSVEDLCKPDMPPAVEEELIALEFWMGEEQFRVSVDIDSGGSRLRGERGNDPVIGDGVVRLSASAGRA